MTLSDFDVLENVQAITQQITPFKLKQQSSNCE